MKKSIVILFAFILQISCKAQEIKEHKLKEQNIRIEQNKNSMKKVSDVLKAINTPIIDYTLGTKKWNDSGFDVISLKFYPEENKDKLYVIYVYLKHLEPVDRIMPIVRKYDFKWSREIANYFKDREVVDVKTFVINNG